MTKHFEVLDEQEYNTLTDAVAVIAIYIAGADGNIETKELLKAEKMTKIRAYDDENYDLGDFYKHVGKDFNEKLENYVNTLPADTQERTEALEGKLKVVNGILQKLDTQLGAALYTSLKSFAEHVAKATGGFLGLLSVGPNEAKLMKLSMIQPIEWEAPLEDDDL